MCTKRDRFWNTPEETCYVQLRCRLPLFTKLPRRVLLGNSVSGTENSRKPVNSVGKKKKKKEAEASTPRPGLA